VSQRVPTERLVPRATYRVQLHPGNTFDDVAELVPYLAELGVSHLYLSPALEAVPGSMHGYDVVDPTRIRAELGGEESLRSPRGERPRGGARARPRHRPEPRRAREPGQPVVVGRAAHGPHGRYGDHLDIAGGRARTGSRRCCSRSSARRSAPSSRATTCGSTTSRRTGPSAAGGSPTTSTPGRCGPAAWPSSGSTRTTSPGPCGPSPTTGSCCASCSSTSTTAWPTGGVATRSSTTAGSST
jgi:hypothetical protein